MQLEIKYCIMGLRVLPVCVCVCVCVCVYVCMYVCAYVHACKCGCASETLRPTQRKIKSLLEFVQTNTSTNLYKYTKDQYLKTSLLSASNQ